MRAWKKTVCGRSAAAATGLDSPGHRVDAERAQFREQEHDLGRVLMRDQANHRAADVLDALVGVDLYPTTLGPTGFR